MRILNWILATEIIVAAQKKHIHNIGFLDTYQSIYGFKAAGKQPTPVDESDWFYTYLSIRLQPIPTKIYMYIIYIYIYWLSQCQLPAVKREKKLQQT